MSTCNFSIEDLGRGSACQNNMSGVKTLYFVPLDDVTAINAARPATIADFADFVTLGSSSMSTKAVSLGVGKKWAKIYCSTDMGELKYALQGSRVGSRSFKATLEVFHPKFKKQLLGFLSAMANAEMLVMVQLNNGEYHLLGDMEHGCILSDGLEATSGKAATDDNGATLQFEYQTPQKQVMFDGWTPDNATYGLDLEPVSE